MEKRTIEAGFQVQNRFNENSVQRLIHQEIEGQIEAEKKLQEKLILEDFGPSTAGRVRFYHGHGGGDLDGDGHGRGHGQGHGHAD